MLVLLVVLVSSLYSLEGHMTYPNHVVIEVCFLLALLCSTRKRNSDLHDSDVIASSSSFVINCRFSNCYCDWLRDSETLCSRPNPESWEIFTSSARFFRIVPKLTIISSNTTGNWSKMFARSRGTARKVQAKSFELYVLGWSRAQTVWFSHSA